MSAQAPGLSPLRAAIMVGGQGSRMGGPKATLRLPDGSSLLHRLYGAEKLTERHCHTHIVNPQSAAALSATGLTITGKCGEEISAVERSAPPPNP